MRKRAPDSDPYFSEPTIFFRALKHECRWNMQSGHTHIKQPNHLYTWKACTSFMQNDDSQPESRSALGRLTLICHCCISSLQIVFVRLWSKFHDFVLELRSAAPVLFTCIFIHVHNSQVICVTWWESHDFQFYLENHKSSHPIKCHTDSTWTCFRNIRSYNLNLSRSSFGLW